MKIYLDSGNLEEIKEAAKSQMLDGITTNPSLIAKEKINFKEHIKQILLILKKNKIEKFTLSAEVTNLESSSKIVEEAKKLVKIDKHIIIKIPITYEGIKAISILSQDGIRCNATLCFSTNQALLAAKAGAWCVSPFIGRLDDIGENGLHLIHEIKTIYENYNFDTRILAASIRNPEHVKNCAIIGCDITTIPFKIFKQLYIHPLTDKGLDKFNSDWQNYEKELGHKQ